MTKAALIGRAGGAGCGRRRRKGRGRRRRRGAMAAAAGPFSLREVLDAFRRCVTEQREVLLEPYLSGWRGLIR